MKNKEKKEYNIYGWTVYDEKDKVVQKYWQKEPMVTRMSPPFKLDWRVRFNPIWRLKQWWLLRKETFVFGDDAYGTKPKETK